MKIQKNNTKTPLTIAAILLIVMALGFAGYKYYLGASNGNQDSIDYSPATQDDKKFNDNIKQDIVDDTPEPARPSSTEATNKKNNITPAITVYGQPEGRGTDFTLNGFVPGIIETDGKCTLTLSKNGQTVTTTKEALRNAQNTSCGQMVISYVKLTPGTWEATLSYASSTSEGSSGPVIVEVK